MVDREFESGRSGPGVPLPRRGGMRKTEEHRRAGTPAMPEGSIDNAIDNTDNTGKRPQRQAYPIRVLKRRYVLSRNYAAIVAARWEAA